VAGDGFTSTTNSSRSYNWDASDKEITKVQVPQMRVLTGRLPRQLRKILQELIEAKKI